MSKSYARTERVGEQIRRELAELIRTALDDPRMTMVSITDTEVSRDLGHARVYITHIGSDRQVREELVDDLNAAAGFLRGELGRRVRLRTVPRLVFVYDESVERGSRLSALITTAVAEDQARHGGPLGTPADDQPVQGQPPGVDPDDTLD